ncbi:hypothetical protein PYCCODRAFT_1441199 [Trametes coccinea BRFM310]|uniref:Uncharacterized protein n=1 Tax=Trametes coccinea (strain BRFM310) TaxID=1353009 RepID=A0A1Y2I6D0_TRAC3|nr:hypothetical protein PYCCODRAFT_1441203 [Trametes coccinea BRFM310]OSC96203.1 hypothetical protein PYCCODRAFT_1441199 [Trametes coccinea BRFM310]
MPWMPLRETAIPYGLGRTPTRRVDDTFSESLRPADLDRAQETHPTSAEHSTGHPRRSCSNTVQRVPSPGHAETLVSDEGGQVRVHAISSNDDGRQGDTVQRGAARRDGVLRLAGCEGCATASVWDARCCESGREKSLHMGSASPETGDALATGHCRRRDREESIER